MKWLTKRLQRFIVQAVIADFEANGPLRTYLQSIASVLLQQQRSESLKAVMLVGSPSRMAVRGRVKAGNAFK